MPWKDAHYLPSRSEFLEMLERERATTADALSEAKQTGDLGMLLQHELRLADWDKLIERMRGSFS